MVTGLANSERVRTSAIVNSPANGSLTSNKSAKTPEPTSNADDNAITASRMSPINVNDEIPPGSSFRFLSLKLPEITAWSTVPSAKIAMRSSALPVALISAVRIAAGPFSVNGFN